MVSFGKARLNCYFDTLAAYPPRRATRCKPAPLFAVHRNLFTIRCATARPAQTPKQSHIMAHASHFEIPNCPIPTRPSPPSGG